MNLLHRKHNILSADKITNSELTLSPYKSLTRNIQGNRYESLAIKFARSPERFIGFRRTNTFPGPAKITLNERKSLCTSDTHVHTLAHQCSR